MTPAARLAAAASVLDSIAQGRAPAETVLKTWGSENRYAGSKDRRAVAERVYQVLRARGSLVQAMGGREDGRALVIGALSLLDGLSLAEIESLHTGDGYGPKPLSKQERSRLAIAAGEGETGEDEGEAVDIADQPGSGQSEAGLPDFVIDDFKATYGERWAEEAHEMMSTRAPIDLRVNAAKATVKEVETELRAAGLKPVRTPWSAWGLRLAADSVVDISSLPAFKSGRVEIQDEGSQVACWLAGVKPGMTVIDYCAGGGGKTLGLAVQGVEVGAARAPEVEEPAPQIWTPTGWVDAPKGPRKKAGPAVSTGRLIAYDVVKKRLDSIAPRLERAGVTADLIQLGPNGGGVESMIGQADVVLVDAPCTGSGTWRRRPGDAWRLKFEDVARMHDLQTTILARAAKLVKPGGRLVYVTCSVLSGENEYTLDVFEEDHPQFAPVSIAEGLNTETLTDAARERLGELAAGGHRLRMSPASTYTDGFFVAIFERTA